MEEQRFVKWSPHWTVQQMALEVARVAHEGLGGTELGKMRAAFDQTLEQASDDPEVQLRAIVRLLIKKTRRDSGSKSVADCHFSENLARL